MSRLGACGSPPTVRSIGEARAWLRAFDARDAITKVKATLAL
jgi:hypothetical protein